MQTFTAKQADLGCEVRTRSHKGKRTPESLESTGLILWMIWGAAAQGIIMIGIPDEGLSI